MARTAVANGRPNGAAAVNEKGAAVSQANTSEFANARTDYAKWRLRDERGRQTWHYLDDDEDAKQWPQTIADKWHLGLPTNLPDLPSAKTPSQAVQNGLTFFSKLQLEPGNWGCEYGGPMFLLPGLVITWYVTETPIPEHIRIEIKNYLFARQNPKDGSWGLHIEGEGSVFGLALNYTVLRILGVEADHPRMVRARAALHELGGATSGPHWAKFWLSVLGAMPWECVNPVPPELWLLPDWVPIAPWRWWIHMRQVFLPMSYVYSKRWSYPPTDLTRQLRQELYTQPYESINFAAHRNSISARDNYNPKSWALSSINWLLVNIWNPYVCPKALTKRAEAWVYELVQREDENTVFANLGPVNGPMNLLCCYIKEGSDNYAVRRHRERMHDFLWVNAEGMMMNGTNGVQTWDTAFLIQTVVACGLADDPQWKPMLTKALEFLEDQQMLENCREQGVCYRHDRKGAWGFSTRDQGYTVSDCTSEAIKSVMMLQVQHGYPQKLSGQRIKDAIDVILTMQNDTGGVASYETRRGGEWLEILNAAEVFGRIMVEYDYPECTTACVTALSLHRKIDPEYRKDDIDKFLNGALDYIRKAQRPDGSWYGSWGICFTYATMFALESLASVGETFENSARVRRACRFLVDRQFEDGGWGESYRACETGVWTPHEKSQVVQTAWASIGLMEAHYPDAKPLKKAMKLIMQRQCPNGEWNQEAIEGVFNKSCMISYPNYKFIFPIKALGMFAKQYEDSELL